MKSILTTVFLLVGSLAWAAPAPAEADSLVILFGNKTRLVIHSEDKSGIRRLSNYDINKIIRDMGMKLDSSRKGETFVVIDQNSVQRYLQDTVLVVTKKDGEVSVTIRESGDRADWSKKDNDDDDDNNNNRSSNRSDRSRNYRHRGDWNSGVKVAIGLNSLIEQSPMAAYPPESYELRPLGSRFVSIGFGQTPTIVRGRVASFKVYYALEAAWNNYMFDKDILIIKEPTGVSFPDAGRELQKSKLTVCSINVPFVPRVTFYNPSGRKVFHLGAGAYAGYRIDSYTKVKEMNDEKTRSHSNFYLNNFRYGLVAHLGIVGINFFVKYDLNPLFQAGKGPDVRVLTFGLGL